MCAGAYAPWTALWRAEECQGGGGYFCPCSAWSDSEANGLGASHLLIKSASVIFWMTSDARQDGLHLMALLSTQKSLLFLARRSSAGSPRAPSSAQGARVLKHPGQGWTQHTGCSDLKLYVLSLFRKAVLVFYWCLIILLLNRYIDLGLWLWLSGGILLSGICLLSSSGGLLMEVDVPHCRAKANTMVQKSLSLRHRDPKKYTVL